MTTGVLRWGIKSSMLDYVRMLPDGTLTFDGVDAREQRVFEFPLIDASGWTGEGGILRFGGEFRSTGHHGTRLTTIVLPSIEVRGTVGRLSVQRWDGRDTRLEIAEFDWPAGEPTEDGVRRLLAPAMAIEGGEIFGDVYTAGTPLDEAVVVLDL